MRLEDSVEISPFNVLLKRAQIKQQDYRIPSLCLYYSGSKNDSFQSINYFLLELPVRKSLHCLLSANKQCRSVRQFILTSCARVRMLPTVSSFIEFKPVDTYGITFFEIHSPLGAIFWQNAQWASLGKQNYVEFYPINTI